MSEFEVLLTITKHEKQMPISRWFNKYIQYIYKIKSAEKEKKIDTCHMDESQINYAKLES